MARLNGGFPRRNGAAMNAVPRELDFGWTASAELGDELLARIDALRAIDPILWSEANQVWMVTGSPRGRWKGSAARCRCPHIAFRSWPSGEGPRRGP